MVVDPSSSGTLHPQPGLFGLTRDHWYLVASGLLVAALVAAFFAPQLAQRSRVAEYGMVLDQTNEIIRRTAEAQARNDAVTQSEAHRTTEMHELAERSLALAAIDGDHFSDTDRQLFAEVSRDFFDLAAQDWSLETASAAQFVRGGDSVTMKRIPDFEVNRQALRHARVAHADARHENQRALAQLADREDRQRTREAIIEARSRDLGGLAATFPDRAATIIADRGVEDAASAEFRAAADDASTLAAAADVGLHELLTAIEHFSTQAPRGEQRHSADRRPALGGEAEAGQRRDTNDNSTFVGEGEEGAPPVAIPDDDVVPLPEHQEPSTPGDGNTETDGPATLEPADP